MNEVRCAKCNKLFINDGTTSDAEVCSCVIGVSQNVKSNGEYMKFIGDELEKYKEENKQLIEFAIWMTGCGYDFCQHEYFIEQRDKLLKK